MIDFNQLSIDEIENLLLDASIEESAYEWKGYSYGPVQTFRTKEELEQVYNKYQTLILTK